MLRPWRRLSHGRPRLWLDERLLGIGIGEVKGGLGHCKAKPSSRCHFRRALDPSRGPSRFSLWMRGKGKCYPIG